MESERASGGKYNILQLTVVFFLRLIFHHRYSKPTVARLSAMVSISPEVLIYIKLAILTCIPYYIGLFNS